MTSTSDPLTYTCTVCSARPGEGCRDRAWRDCGPHMGRLALAGLIERPLK